MLHPRAGRFGREDDIIAAFTTFEPAADIALGAALGLGMGRHRVHLGSVDKIDAERDSPIELLMSLGFAVLLAEGHGAQAQAANLDSRVAKRSRLHHHSCHKTNILVEPYKGGK